MPDSPSPMRTPESTPTTLATTPPACQDASAKRRSLPEQKLDAKLASASEALAHELAAAVARLTASSQEAVAIQQTLLQKLHEANHRAAALEAKLEARTAQRSTGTVSADTTNLSIDPAVDATTHREMVEAELSFLRLELRGIELRSRAYVPEDADPELAQSIANWKADWAALRAQVDAEDATTRQMTRTSLQDEPSLRHTSDTNAMIRSTRGAN